MISGTVDFACATPRPQPAVAGGRVEGKGFAVAVSGARTDVFSDGTVIVAASGSPRFPQPGAPTPAAGWAERYRIHGFDAPREVRGTFAVAIVDLAQRRALLAVDRFAIEPLCHAERGPVLSFATRADRVPLDAAPELDPQAIFNYLYFHVIPAPRTIFRDVARLRSGHALRFENDRASSAPFWRPRFVEDSAAPLDELKTEFRGLVRDAVAHEADGASVGCFLSGGTDSSTVAGMLREVTGEPPRTYSIGFAQAGYDEMAYARIAARHFAAVHHEHYVTPKDLAEGMPKVAAYYDQPFGNSSAVPAFYCAAMARADGVERLLAGDGGDELFGGNARYAKQRLFEAYSALPQALRSGLLEPLLLGTSGSESGARPAQGHELCRTGTRADAGPGRAVQPAPAVRTARGALARAHGADRPGRAGNGAARNLFGVRCAIDREPHARVRLGLHPCRQRPAEGRRERRDSPASRSGSRSLPTRSSISPCDCRRV